MRIVFVNLHANEMLVKNLSKIIFKQSVAIKHAYFLRWLLDNPDLEVCSYITPNGFSMGDAWGAIGRFLDHFRFLEHRYIMHKNGIDRKKVSVIKSLDGIMEDDIVIMHRLGFKIPKGTKIPGMKVFSMIHFGQQEAEMSCLMQSLDVDVIFNESNLAKFSDMFRKFYSWYKKDLIVHPFVFQERFKPIKPFVERENKVFTTGTVTYKENDDFISVYGDPCVQPIRRMMKVHGLEYPELIYSTCSDYSEDAKTQKLSANANFFRRLWYTFYYKTHASQQKQYCSFDMVEMFNNYKMCLVGEEILGVPGIGAIEGMACGCAMLGLNTGLYEEYGLKEGVHYIGHNGTFEDILEKIRYWQKTENQKRLEKIAKDGCEYVRSHFNSNAVAEELYNKLVAVYNDKLKK